MIWSHKHTGPLLRLRCVNCVNSYYYQRKVFSGLTLKSIHLSLIHNQPGQMARPLPRFYHSRSPDKQAVGWWVPSQTPDGWRATAAEKKMVGPLMQPADLQCCLLSSRGQWWSFTSARGLIRFCSSERRTQKEALSQKMLNVSLTKYSPVLHVFSIIFNCFSCQITTWVEAASVWNIVRKH